MDERGTKATFDDLGIPFPLFAAPAEEAIGYLGRSTCSLCDKHDAHCFESPQDEGAACYDCLRSGRTTISKDTVVGTVGGRLAEQGMTDAVGVSKTRLEEFGFEVIPHRVEPDAPDWHQVKVPAEYLLELLRTPDYCTYQGSIWLFCCQRPMVYQGIWKEAQFEKFAGDTDPAQFFNSVMTDIPDCDFVWGKHAPLDGCGGPYVFKCPSCNTFKGNHDMC